MHVTYQGRSQDFGSGEGEGQTKFPVKSQEFRFEAVTFKNIYLIKIFKFFKFILKSQKNL